jgi:cellulose synthase/poly-beta-1,6-N-acetylglucosamine synthase-like glycosyltransferase
LNFGILVPDSDQFGDFLSAWQFGNFFLDKLLFRPAEELVGYLSVLPGQFSMFRWQALTDNWSDKTLVIPQPSPLKQYFRGLEQLETLEATMFLAEDRVLGFELLTSLSPSYKLVFLPTVVTVTDSCQSFARAAPSAAALDQRFFSLSILELRPNTSVFKQEES